MRPLVVAHARVCVCVSECVSEHSECNNLYGFNTSSVEESPFMCQGPFSVNKPIKEEQPGPPFNHSTIGSVVGERYTK